MEVDGVESRPFPDDEDNQSPFASRQPSLALPTPHTLGPLSFGRKSSSSSTGALQASSSSSSSSKPSNKNVPPPKEPYGLHEFTALTATLKAHSISDGEFAVDIVAIQGLTGGCESTWLHEDSGVIWLRDFLPADMPGARVFSYGYNADIWNSKSVADWDNYATEMLAYFQSQLAVPPLPPNGKVRNLQMFSEGN